MDKEKIISFPHLGNYHVPISYLLSKLTNAHVMPAPPITKKTIELGSKYSPDFVCLPFKYNLGNFIEALECGANVLLQAGGGCRYGCYAEVQEQILRDLGYDFEFLSLTSSDKITPLSVYKTFRNLNPKLSIFSFIRHFIITFMMIKYMDILYGIVRKNIGFELNDGSFEKTLKSILKRFKNNTGLFSLTRTYIKARKKLKSLPVKKSSDCLRVGIIGELYTNMEPFASYFIEKELAKMNVEVKRFTNVSYLLVEKAVLRKRNLRQVKKYLKYTIGADGMDNVWRAKYLIKNGYDGIIHIKPFGCTPEISAIPIIDRVCKESKMPIIYFSFDSQNSDEGVKTRLEALVDMLNEKRRSNRD